MLDDGFQHRRLARDLDLVLLDALDPFGLGRMFPRGLLREPVGSLAAGGSGRPVPGRPGRGFGASGDSGRGRTAAGPLRWVETRHAPLDLIDAEGISSPIEMLAGQSVAAFCGIGNPEGFRRTLLPLCRELVDFRIFPDHHAYAAADVGSLERWARDLGANLVLTTQKDLVKLRASLLGPVPLRALRIGLEVMAGSDIMDDVLARLLPARHRDEPLEKEFS